MPDVQAESVIRTLGLTFSSSVTIAAETATILNGVSLAAAKTGSLTTRTSDSVGTITADTGHGIITGDTLDIYWSGGVRYGVTVGTVATNSIPITSGSGDVLPAAGTALTLFVPVSESFVVPASSAKAIAVLSPSGKTRVSFRTSAPALSFTTTASGTSETVYLWNSSTSGTNPLSTDAIATVLLSNGNIFAVTPSVLVAFTT